MIEIRWHGRGGQGAVTSVEMLALAAIEEGKYAQGFPAFGPERRGAPVMAFNRVSDKPIKIRSGIYRPDVVVVLDPSLVGLVPVTDGLKPGGILIVNTTKPAEDLRKKLNYSGKLFTVDASHIAREELGVPIDHAWGRPQGHGRSQPCRHEIAPRAPFRPRGRQEHVRHEAGL
jgi:2-oxoacid:acceptor oxidoreductase gamma subunit (pyruvate/2-ketoisovalerate family)